MTDDQAEIIATIRRHESIQATIKRWLSVQSAYAGIGNPYARREPNG